MVDADWRLRIMHRRGVADTDITPWHELHEAKAAPYRRLYGEQRFDDRLDELVVQHLLVANSCLEEAGVPPDLLYSGQPPLTLH